MRLLIFGPQLSGKGTQAGRIAQACRIEHITTGNILREMFAHGSAATKKILAPSMLRGILLSDEKMNRIVAQYLAKHPDGFILDGYPRTMNQTRFLESYLKKHHEAMSAAIFLDVPHAELMKRLNNRIKHEKRADDHPDILKSRLAQYEHKTIPVVNHYKKRGLLLDINGVQTRSNVFKDILKALRKEKLLE